MVYSLTMSYGMCRSQKEDKNMKATEEFIANIPADAMVSYSDRINPDNNYSSTWGEEAEESLGDFPEQFYGASVTRFVDDGSFDGINLSECATGKTVYMMTLEEGEHTDKEGTCAAERIDVMWSV
jgi:hypothetical protein